MNKFKDFIITNFTKVLPSGNEIIQIEKYLEKVYNKSYKKIVCYAMGTSRQVIELIRDFYSMKNHQFSFQIISDYNKEISNYLFEELIAENLLIFCSRSGSTAEVIYQLQNLIAKKPKKKLLDNILVLSNKDTNNRLYNIALQNQIKIINIKNGDLSRFECVNSVFFFIIELFEKRNDLVFIRNRFTQPDSYKKIFDEFAENLDSLSKIDIKSNFKIIVYSANSKLDGVLGWFKHLYYETFGTLEISIHFESYSSLFHSSVQHYMNHLEVQYNVICLYNEDIEFEYLKDNFLAFLPKKQIFHHKIENDVAKLLKDMIKSIFFLCSLAEIYNIDILDQIHVDNYKKRSLEKIENDKQIAQSTDNNW